MTSSSDASYIHIDRLGKSFGEIDEDGNRAQVFEDFALSVKRGELLAILGPNGCGKTTLLRIIAGLVVADEGDVTISTRPPSQCRIGMMYQNFSATLFPWLKNIDNIAFVLDKSFGNREGRRAYVREFVEEKMGLDDLPLEKYPYQCSGGQQQLVALARELAYQPDVLLLDEPFAALDYERRLQQHNHLLSIWQRTRATIVLVSHDVDDALFLADRIVLLSHRPASIVALFEIDLPRPRRAEMQADRSYADLRREVLQRFLGVLRG